jgi:hypothetical protein
VAARLAQATNTKNREKGAKRVNMTPPRGGKFICEILQQNRAEIEDCEFSDRWRPIPIIYNRTFLHSQELNYAPVV